MTKTNRLIIDVVSKTKQDEAVWEHMKLQQVISV